METVIRSCENPFSHEWAENGFSAQRSKGFSAQRVTTRTPEQWSINRNVAEQC
ncbi:MAG: hypothetical protein WBE26_12820 [Phycisphaerae bacterium]